MAKDGPSTSASRIDDVFEFNSECDVEYLRTFLKNLIIELHKNIKLFIVLSIDCNDIREDKQREIIEMQTAFQIVDSHCAI